MPGKDPTLGETLVAAKRAMEKAERAFRVALVDASDKGTSTRDMAELLGVSHSTLWRWMGGRNKRPSHDVLGKPITTWTDFGCTTIFGDDDR